MGWVYDENLSRVRWCVGYLGIARVSGVFKSVAVDWNLDEDEPRQWSVGVRIDAASLDSGYERMDEHIRSADMLDVATYPTIVFQSQRVEPAGDESIRADVLSKNSSKIAEEQPAGVASWSPRSDVYRVQGELTLHGVTRPTFLDMVYRGEASDRRGMTRRAFSGGLSIKRADYGIYVPPQVELTRTTASPEVDVVLDVIATKME